MKVRITTEMEFPNLKSLDSDDLEGNMAYQVYPHDVRRWVMARFQDMVTRATSDALRTWFVVEELE